MKNIASPGADAQEQSESKVERQRAHYASVTSSEVLTDASADFLGSAAYRVRVGDCCRPSQMLDHVDKIHLRSHATNRMIEFPHPMYEERGVVLQGQRLQ